MIPKIAVTGTKGKTTVVNVVSQLLQRSGEYDRVLHVDTTGHFINGERKSTLEDSQKNWGLVPSVAPGRYLYEFLHHAEEERLAAVLETSLGCSTLSGMGYALHHVGVFLNVFEDHIGNSERIKSQADILEAKLFVVRRTLRDGYAVLNLDDPFIRSALHEIPVDRAVQPIFFGLSLDRPALPEPFTQAGFVTIRDEMVVYDTTAGTHTIVDARSVPWTFDGVFTPSLYNLMAVIATVLAFKEGMVPPWLSELLPHISLNPNGGRLVRLRSQSGVEIIADYAHEKQSLVEIARLARTLAAPEGRVIGVVRLAYDRTDQTIQETGQIIAREFDHLVVYDKIDGHFRKPKEKLQFERFKQEVGLVSQKLADAIQEVNPHCDRIIREDEALTHAAAIAKPGDVVVSIVNDNIPRSMEFIKESFAAECL